MKEDDEGGGLLTERTSLDFGVVLDAVLEEMEPALGHVRGIGARAFVHIERRMEKIAVKVV